MPLSALNHTNDSLQGKLLIATPLVGGSFNHSVVFLLSHSEEGAMGLIINQPTGDIAYGDVYEQLGLQSNAYAAETPVHFGGPVEATRGFVLYRPEKEKLFPDSVTVGDIAISASAKVLEAIANGEGPREHLLTIGYAGWDAGQLEREIEENSWMIAPCDSSLVFDTAIQDKWKRAAFSLGVDMGKFSMIAGHA